MNVIVAGGRDERLTPERKQALAEALWHLNDGRLTLLLGGCRGIDEDVRAASGPWGYPYRFYPADWRTHGRVAGPKRNQRMIDDADSLVVFPGGRGTADVTARAERKGIPVTRLA